MSGSVEERAKAALQGVSPGPWRWEPSKYIRTGYVITAGNRTAVHATEWGEVWAEGPKPEQFNHADANFAAEARTLIPELVAALERVRSLHWPSPNADPSCDCYDGRQPCSTIQALDGVS